MHPNGQLPAYEWNFSDVNPPVQAWAALRIYECEQRQNGGKGDHKFLEIVFTKLLLNFTWWVNRKDPRGLNVFQGGFLGMDNIGSFDRSAPLPVEGTLVQSDGTSWMAMYSLNMLRIAMELAQEDDAYEDIATKFFEHFLMIGGAMTNLAGEGLGLWDDQDNFFYDWLVMKNGEKFPLRVRSLVGLIPIFAVEVIDGAGAGARHQRVPVALWRAIPLALPPRPALCLRGQGLSLRGQVCPGGIRQRSVRRQFQLVWADLDADQLSARRKPSKVRQVLRPGLQGGSSGRLGPDAIAERDCRRPAHPAHQALPS